MVLYTCSCCGNSSSVNRDLIETEKITNNFYLHWTKEPICEKCNSRNYLIFYSTNNFVIRFLSSSAIKENQEENK